MAEEKRILEDSRRLQRIVEGSRGYVLGRGVSLAVRGLKDA